MLTFFSVFCAAVAVTITPFVGACAGLLVADGPDNDGKVIALYAASILLGWAAVALAWMAA